MSPPSSEALRVLTPSPASSSSIDVSAASALARDTPRSRSSAQQAAHAASVTSKRPTATGPSPMIAEKTRLAPARAELNAGSGCHGRQTPMGSSQSIGPAGEGVQTRRCGSGAGAAAGSGAKRRGGASIRAAPSRRASSDARTRQCAGSAYRSSRSCNVRTTGCH
eukprot:4018609-Pleurochrysis_carterae.AAC.1